MLGRSRASRVDDADLPKCDFSPLGLRQLQLAAEQMLNGETSEHVVVLSGGDVNYRDRFRTNHARHFSISFRGSPTIRDELRERTFHSYNMDVLPPLDVCIYFPLSSFDP